MSLNAAVDCIFSFRADSEREREQNLLVIRSDQNKGDESKGCAQENLEALLFLIL